jgi:hypothetical protein
MTSAQASERKFGALEGAAITVRDADLRALLEERVPDEAQPVLPVVSNNR